MTRMTSLPDDAHLARVMALGELTASIAHELCQPLAAIALNGKASLHWLDRPAPEVDQARATVEALLGSVHRAGEIIRRLHTLSRKGSIEKRKLDLSEVVGEVVPLVEPRLREGGLSLRLDLADGPAVLGDSVQLQQVVLNLMMNAIQATAVDDRPGILTVRSRFRAREAWLSVSDNGTGLDPQAADHLFEPFFTTKAQGTGLGLSICRSIVEAHGGRIWATNNKGRGATFQFTVPVAGEARPRRPVAAARSPRDHAAAVGV